MASRLGEETSATQVKYAFEQGCTLGGLHALPLALLLPSLSGSLLESALHPLVAQRIGRRQTSRLTLYSYHG